MQYVLTEEEYEKLKNPKELIVLQKAHKHLLEVFRKNVAVPCEDNEDAYCDDCPLATLNLYELEISADVANEVCNDTYQRFSK